MENTDIVLTATGPQTFCDLGAILLPCPHFQL